MAEKKGFINFLEKSLTFDRRYIFLFVLIAVILPTIFPLNLRVDVTPETLGVFNAIDAIPDGSHILVSFDYEPASIAENDPQAKAILRHCFKKKLKVVATTFIVLGSGIGEKLFKEMEKEFDLKYGVDYTWLGYRAGYSAMIIGLGDSLKETYRTDVYGNPTKDLPILQGIETLKDFPYMVCVADDAYLDYWIIYAYERFGLKIGTACTAVMAPGFYPYLDVGQVTGIIGGLKGASEYEKLMGYKGFGHIGMDTQTIIHSVIIIMIVLGNIAYLILKKYSDKGEVK